MNSSPSLPVLPSISSDHHPRTFLMASNASRGVWSTVKVMVKSFIFFIFRLLPRLSVTQIEADSSVLSFCHESAMLLKSCRGLRHETCVLTLERLGYAIAPALGDGLRRGIGEDILFAILQSIEDARRD